MINTLVPKNIACKVIYESSDSPYVHEAEIQLVKNTTKHRKIEFLNGRNCAHLAMKTLGYKKQDAILIGENHEPLWPVNLVGSITHCNGYYAATVSFKKDYTGIGIDSELNSKLPTTLIKTTQTNIEITRNKNLVKSINKVCINKLIFSAKESIFKFIYPKIKRYINFMEAEILLDFESKTFSVSFVDSELISLFNHSTIIGKFNYNSTHIVTCAYEPT